MCVRFSPPPLEVSSVEVQRTSALLTHTLPVKHIEWRSESGRMIDKLVCSSCARCFPYERLYQTLALVVCSSV